MSENSSKIGKYQFVAEPFHVDFTGRLTMGVLGNHLLNCAGFHASDRGFGIAMLNEDNYTWVLSRLAIELDEMPFQYEDFTIWWRMYTAFSQIVTLPCWTKTERRLVMHVPYGL